jgi:hypothetical protein
MFVGAPLTGLKARRDSYKYECCEAVYVDITFSLHLVRRTMFYTFNTLIPCVLISSLTVLVFALPPDSGEKVTLGITILLSMTVFLVQLSETMPSTSESLSMIGTSFVASGMCLNRFMIVSL